MAFTLVKAIEELTSRLGEPSGGKVPNWAYRHLYYYRFLHSPFSDIPGLSSLFEVRSEAVGNPRTLNMSWAQKFGKGGPYEATAATVYRQVIDLGDPTSIHIAMDLGIQQQSLQSPHRTDFKKLFDNGRYFRLPTTELAEQVRFKLKETGETIKFAASFDENH
jgi:hypothetical protein